ncbi:MAG: YhdH/YhfP family quinone oxidoreductase [Paraglaciecola sp.]|uniref:YhdH/YhfP family quinone oxidoreductase n=1 Tax=Paraglaciecola sp. TaxID=1920173 RepID=UPI00273D2D63|nr:YhdH/YhfP family quinone oxidoreductase [Paraglaciecola sp.]MDP5031529.1 YhdH/YhfP family quinone oxidoreductase [Paraglaciecola sp.]MDP5132500.1 YhdH/YhfP family quinone oxidoreductase [Paraglaciecola sp.]
MSTSDTFKALVVEEQSDHRFTKSVIKRSISELPENDLLIDVHYSSLNFKDAMSASGNKRISQHFPHTPGIDAAGVVVNDKSGIFNQGDEVLVFGYDLGMNTPGGLGQKISIPANWAVLRPDTLTLKEAMIYGTGGLTAALCIQKLEKMGASPSDGRVAVTGATGGVGSISIALLSQLGYEVVAFSGKPEQSEKLKALGATEVLHRDSILDVKDALAGKPRWAHAIDTLGGDFLTGLLKQLKPGGGVASVGLAASPEIAMSVIPFITRGISLLGVDSVYIPLKDKQDIWQRVATDMKLADLEKYHHEISLQETPEYLDKFLKGQVIGRYLVNVRNA